MDILNTLTPLLRPAAEPGRMLITHWPAAGGDVATLQAFAERMNLAPVVLAADERAADRLADVSATVVTGDLLGDVEGSHYQFSLVIVPGPLLVGHHSQPEPTDWQHVLYAAPYMAAGCVLALWADRRRLAANPRWISGLLQNYNNLQIYETAPHRLLVAGARRGSRALSATGRFDELRELVARGANIPAAPSSPQFSLKPYQGRLAMFRSKRFDAVDFGRFAARLPWGEKALSHVLFGWRQPVLQPVMPLRASFLGIAIAAGALGTVRATSPRSGHDVVMRGKTLRRVTDIPGRRGSEAALEEGESEVRTPERDSRVGDFTTCITLLDLTDRTMRQVDPQLPSEMTAFLEEWGEVLATRAADAYRPDYEPDKAPYWEILDPLYQDVINQPIRSSGRFKVRNLSGTDLPSLTMPQRHTLASLILRLKGPKALRQGLEDDYAHLRERRNLILQGEPSVGKTGIMLRLQLALITDWARRHGNLKLGDRGWPVSVFVTVPARVRSLADEARAFAPILQPRPVENLGDLQAALREAETSPAPLLLILSRSMLTRVQKIEPVFRWGDPPYQADPNLSDIEVPQVFCVSCGGQLEIGRWQARRWTPELLLGGGLKARGLKCQFCEHSLWQETLQGGRLSRWLSGELRPPARNKGPYSLALHLTRELYRRRIKLLSAVFDEVHEDANASNQGQAMAWIAQAADYAVGCSGTVYGGHASSSFLIFHRLIPEFRREWGYHEARRFVKMYGYWRQERRDDGQWGSSYELPGVSPEMVASVFLNYCAFLTRADSGLPSPEREDRPAMVALSPDEAEGLEELMKAARGKMVATGDARQRRLSVDAADLQRLYLGATAFHLPVMARYSPAWRCPRCGHSKVGERRCRHWWDVDDEQPPAHIPPAERVQPVLDADYVSAKEAALVDLLQTERTEGRTAIVYVEHTGKYDLDTRVAQVLERAGLRVLRLAGLSTRVLEQLINLAPLEGYDAIVINPRRIGSGTNLIATPTTIWYQPIWRARLTIQAGERADRPTQTRRVRNIFMAAEGSPEMVVLSKVVERMISIWLVGGIDYAGMAAIMDVAGHVESFQEMMIQAVTRHVNQDLAGLFAQYGELLAGSRQGSLPTAAEPAPQTARRVLDLDAGNARQLSLFGGEVADV
jgi:hypothetical protein